MGEPTRILVVEDEGVVAKDLQVRLRKLGYDVPLTVQTGEAAVEAAKELKPGLILMDVRLKGEMDGIEASAKIMQQSRTPVIFLTAYADENTLGRAKLTQPFGFILKPFNERELHTAIQVALHRHGAEAALRKSERWLAGTLRSIREGIIAVDNDLNVLFMNPVAQSLTGWSEIAANGQPLRKVFCLVDSTTGEPLEAAVESALKETPESSTLPPTRTFENGVLLSQGGERIPIEDNAAPILDDDGNVAGGVLVFRDIAQRKQIEQSQRQTENQLRVLADSISQLAWMAEANGDIFWYNKRWYEYTGASLDDMKGWGWKSVHDETLLTEVMERWQGSLQSGTTFDMEFPLRRADGTLRWFLTRAVPVSDAEGKITRWFGTNTDIHEARENRDSLQRANVRLAQFAYSASHDLREPLRNVSVFSKLLGERCSPSLDAKATEYLGFVTEGAIRMDKLVSDLLVYAESSNGILETPLDSIDTQAALKDVLDGLRTLVAESGAQIVADELPSIKIRPVHFKQLLQNILENAIRYKSQTPPVIRITARLEGTYWIFSISDNGIGIDAQYHERIFGLFKRLHTAQAHAGTGLGLALCRNIVDLYGGRIWVESELGAGSKFSFSLPR